MVTIDNVEPFLDAKELRDDDDGGENPRRILVPVSGSRDISCRSDDDPTGALAELIALDRRALSECIRCIRSGSRPIILVTSESSSSATMLLRQPRLSIRLLIN